MCFLLCLIRIQLYLIVYITSQSSFISISILLIAFLRVNNATVSTCGGTGGLYYMAKGSPQHFVIECLICSFTEYSVVAEPPNLLE